MHHRNDIHVSRSPSEVSHFVLYSTLERSVAARTGQQGVADGTTVPFTHAEIADALRVMHVVEQDIEQAIGACLKRRLFVMKGKHYHLTRGRLAEYRTLCRRI